MSGRYPSEAESYDYRACKLKALRSYEDASAKIRRFLDSPLFDRLTQNLIFYFVSELQRVALTQRLLRHHSQPTDRLDVTETTDRIHDLEEERAMHLAAAGQLYGALLLKYSAHTNTQNDRAFFEAVYDALTRVVCTVLERLHQGREIEMAMGCLFRGAAFNLNAKKHQLPRSVDTLSLRQLYEIKHAAQNTSLNARLVKQLYQKRQGLDTKRAVDSRSPLMSGALLSSPQERAPHASLKLSVGPSQHEKQGIALGTIQLSQSTIEEEDMAFLDTLRQRIQSAWPTTSPNGTATQ